MKRFNFFKYTTLGNKVHTSYFDYWFFKKLTQGTAPEPTPAIEGEGTNFELVTTNKKKLEEIKLKGDTAQQTYTGKNLYNKDGTNILSAYIDFTHQSITSIANNRIIWIKCKPSTTYTVSKLPMNNQRGIAYTTELPANGVQTYGYKAGTNGWSSLDFTTGANAEYLVIRIWSSAQDTETLETMLASVQIEEGSTATSYEPYVGGTASPNPDYPQDVKVVTGSQTFTITNGTDVQTYPITLGSTELCKIGTYQDYIYKSGDKWYVKKETASVAVKDNIYWSINNNCFQGTPYAGKKSDSICICTHFTFNPIRSGITSNLTDGEFGFNTSETPTFKYTTITTTTDWNTWLSTNNPIVYYILATPTDTEITDATLLSNLNTLLTDGYLKKGTNTIKTTATGTNLPTIIYIKTN